MELNGLVSQSLYKNTLYENPVKKAQFYANLLRQEYGCNLVICLSHLGYKHNNGQIGDVDLAKLTSNIDLIIGGHTHTFLEAPEVHKSKMGKTVLVNQVGWAGLVLGKVDFYFNENSESELWSSNFFAK